MRPNTNAGTKKCAWTKSAPLPCPVARGSLMLETGSAPVHLQKTQAQRIGTTLITGTGKLGTIPGTVIDVPGNGAGQHGAAKTQLFLKVDFCPGFNAAARTAGRTFAPVVQTTGIASQPTGTGSHEKASLKLTKIAWWHYKHKIFYLLLFAVSMTSCFS